MSALALQFHGHRTVCAAFGYGTRDWRHRPHLAVARASARRRRIATSYVGYEECACRWRLSNALGRCGHGGGWRTQRRRANPCAKCEILWDIVQRWYPSRARNEFTRSELEGCAISTIPRTLRLADGQGGVWWNSQLSRELQNLRPLRPPAGMQQRRRAQTTDASGTRRQVSMSSPAPHPEVDLEPLEPRPKIPKDICMGASCPIEFSHVRATWTQDSHRRYFSTYSAA